MSKLEAITTQFESAINRLAEVLAMQKTSVTRDSAIQRFEFSLDLAWKAVKTFLEERKGMVCASPKECFREAYKQGLIDYDETWLKLVDMRNETTHTYKEELAETIYSQLPGALEYFQKLLNKIRE